MKRSILHYPSLALACVSVCCANAARAEVKLPAIIGNHMVLQSETPLTIWGWANDGEEVTVSIGETKAATQADSNGDWMVKLPPMRARAEPIEMTVRGTNTIQLSDILVGEVWIGSGQSNMQMTVAASNNAAQEIAAADYPSIRLFLVPLVPSGTPAKDVKAAWTICSPDNVKQFSAVCYYFGRELHKTLDAPVGMIASSWGGTAIEPWIPPAGFAAVPELEGERKQIESLRGGHQAALKNKLAEIKNWLEEADRAAAAGELIAEPPAMPDNPFNSNRRFTGLYNGMIDPLAPFAIRGALWYQGEANVGAAMHYHHLMKGLILGWREVWSQGDFPFLFVQLAPFQYNHGPQALPELWEAQTATLRLRHTGMAVTTDIGDIHDIHPRNKQEVGRRLALWALAKTYGRNELVYSGPIYESMAVEGNRIRIKFRHVDGGLTARDGKPLTWFSIAAADKKFVPATATIDGETVLVESAEAPSPAAVRFGWHQIADPNLANKAGLPASPFRTDDWADAVSAAP